MSRYSVPQSHPDSPAALFIELWTEVVTWDASKLLLSSVPPDLKLEAAELLDDDDTNSFMASLRSLLPDGDSMTERGVRLAVMLAIDDALLPIHPRSQRGASGARRATPRRWVVAARELRIASAHYAQLGQQRLVARGPLSRNQRQPYSDFAESLRDRFAALEVVPTHLDLEGRAIDVDHRVVVGSVGKGVRPNAGATIGAERVTVVPVAEQSGDFKLESRFHGAVWLVTYRLEPRIDAAKTLVQGLSAASPVDIGIAPEFVMSEDQADLLPNLLRGLSTSPCRLVVSGTGPTRADREGQHWNECQVFNGAGALLWRQRKLWPAASLGPTIQLFGLPTHDGLGHEDTASGDHIVIADVDGLGRCCVLICQDVVSSLAMNLVKSFQPDWVFVPVLDKWLNAGRWAHQKCFELSCHAPTRLVVARNVGLVLDSASAKSDPDHCLLAVGPGHENDPTDFAARRARFEAIAAGTAPAYASIDWTQAPGWQTSMLGTET